MLHGPAAVTERQDAAVEGIKAASSSATLKLVSVPALDALVSAIAGGDQSALATLYDLSVAKVFALALAVVRRREDAEEVVCDTYTQVWSGANRYDPARASVMGWLLMICRSRALDRLRNRPEESSFEEFDETVAGTAHQDPRDGPAEMLNRFQQSTRVHRALKSLTHVRRRILGLAYFRGMSHQEIAHCMSLPVGTVKSHLRRALGTLREQMGPESP